LRAFERPSAPPSFSPAAGTQGPAAGDQPVAIAAPEFATSFAGGIPFGNWDQPNSAYGSTYNGAVRIIYPEYLLSNLAAIKASGGKIMLDLSGGQKYLKDSDGHFSLTKWKQRVDRFKAINFSSYVKDGTIVGHFLLDEPNDKTNWNGTQVAPSTVEAMAKYSKQNWPDMVTLVRTWPDYLDDWSGTYQYLDAAWAMYTHDRFPDISSFVSTNVSKAQAEGLALVVGLNIMKGGNNGSQMTASQVKTWGSTLLSSSYPCAFIDWKYNSDYLSTSSMKDAMNYLRNKAESKSLKSCRGS
jgi:hypothetical protein